MSGYGDDDDDAINAQAFVDNYVDLARSQLPTGESALNCVRCRCIIPTERRLALKGVQYCVKCQQDNEKIKSKIKNVVYMP